MTLHLTNSTILAVLVQLKTAFHPAIELIATRNYARLIHPHKHIVALGQTARLFDGVVVNLARLSPAVATELYTLHNTHPSPELVDLFATYLNTIFIMPMAILGLLDYLTPHTALFYTCQTIFADLVQRHATDLYNLYTFLDMAKAPITLYIQETDSTLISHICNAVRDADIQLVACPLVTGTPTITTLVLWPQDIEYPDPDPHATPAQYTALRKSSFLAASSKYICTHADAFILQILLTRAYTTNALARLHQCPTASSHLQPFL